MDPSDIKTVGVVGAGLMGSGIGAVFAIAGYGVTIRDTDAGRLETGRESIRKVICDLREAGLLEKSAESILAGIEFTRDLATLQKAQLVIEAIPEEIELKKRLYAELEKHLVDDALLTSNTSGLLPSRLAEDLRRPDRFLIAHFWNPPHAIPLVEIVPGAKTDSAIVASLVEFLRRIGAEPVVISKELPGFIGNRLQYALLREALAIVRSGAATPEAVDTVMKSSLGRRYATVGPLETADLGGLDTFLSIASHLMPQLAKDEDVLDLLRQLVEHGNTGLRSGKGFYEWSPDRVKRVLERRNADLLRRRREERGRTF